MNILMLFQSAPLPPPNDLGGAKRNYPFFRENLKRHDVSVISFGTPAEEKLFREHFGKSCRHIVFIDRRRPRIVNGLEKIWLILTGRITLNQVYRKQFQKAIDRLTSSEQFDLIHFCIPLFGRFELPKNIPLLSDTHNVEYDILHRSFQQTRNILFKIMFFIDYKLSKRFEIDMCRKFDVLLTTTTRDKEIFQKELSDKPIRVIQNGVDQSFFENLNEQPEPKSIVFVGILNWYPNVHALEYFLDRIFPLVLEKEPKAKFTIVGAHPPKKIRERASSNVAVTGFVNDVRPYVVKSEVFVIPLLIGSGIRGKALETMAMKVPIVSTTLGCAGLSLRHNESALFADTPEEFADSIFYLFNNPSERKRITEKAYTIVVEEHDWVKKGLDLDLVYRSLVKSNGQGDATKLTVETLGGLR